MGARLGRRFPIRPHLVKLLTAGAAGPLTAGSLSEVSHTSTTVTLSWTAANGGTGPITEQLQKSLAGAGSWSNVAGSTPATATGLTAATAYDFRVAYTDNLTTVYSNTVTVTTDSPPVFTAGTLSEVSHTAFSATLSWTASTDGTLPVTEQLQRSLSGAGSWSNVSGATSSPATDSSLASATAYDFRVAYTDASPATVYSNTVTVTTDAAVNLYIGTGPGEYSTGQAAINDMVNVTSPGDVVNIIVNGDIVLDESLVFNHASLNLASLTFTVAAPYRHNGTPGSGARIVRSRPTAKTHLLDIRASMTVEWLELDANWALIQDQSQITVPSTVSGVTVTVRNCLAHGSEHKDPRRAFLFAGTTSTFNCINNMVFNHHRWNGPSTKSIAIECSSSTSVFECHNNTVHDVSGLAGGIGILFQDHANHRVSNNLVTYVRLGDGFGASGTSTCFSPASPASAVCSNNVSSDATAPGTSNVRSIHFSDCYVSPSAPYDLHLRAAGVQAYNVGTARVSPSGIETDINGNTRGVGDYEWSAGAHSFGTAGVAATTATLRGPESGRMSAASTNFAVGLDGTYTGTITPASTGNGTFSPTSLTWAGTAETKFFTYTPANTGSRLHEITLSGSPSLTVPAALQYRPYGTNSAQHRWVSGVTNTGCTVAVRTEADEPNTRLNVYAASDRATIVASSAMVASANATNGRVVILPVTGLTANTHYYGYAEINGVEDRYREVEFTTAPTPGTPTSFSFICGSCGDGPYGIGYKRMRLRAPAFLLHAGDIHYQDLNSTTASAYRAKWNAVPTGPYQGELHARVPLAHVWNDHDFCGDASDYNSTGRAAARAAYRENVPNYTLRASGDESIDYSFVWGRVRVVCVDEVSNRNLVAGKSWSAAQMAWFKSELDAAKAAGQVVWWHGGFAYNWSECLSSAEKIEIADYIVSIGMVGQIMRSAGDAHELAADTGVNHDFATGTGCPIPQVSGTPFYQLVAARGGPWSQGTYGPSGVALQQYGLVTVTDTGSQVTFDFVGYDDNDASRITMSVVMPLAGAGGATGGAWWWNRYGEAASCV